MRVITGTARGRALKTPEGDHTRPTAERVKEAVFSIIQFEIEGRKVLDLFAGSGQLGIEALSRGAASAVFIESDKEAAGVVRDNLQKTRLEDKATLLQTDAIAFLASTASVFDIVFLDPPYAANLLHKALTAAAGKTSPGGILVCEHPFADAVPSEVGDFTLQKTYKYGKTAVSVYRRDLT